MFRHKNTTKKEGDKQIENIQDEASTKISKENKVLSVDSGNNSIKELLEKNLKWSQIIYEQNRKINHKLLWSAIAGWLRLLLIVAPLILAILYLPPIAKDLWSKFNTISGTASGTGQVGKDSLNTIINLLNLSSEQEKQVKKILP